MENHLTTGSVGKSVLRFSLPFFLSYFLQTLYGMADLFIIGQFNGVDSTTAVSIGSQVMHMLTVMIVGLAIGGTVLIGQATGAQNQKQTTLAIGNTVTLFMLLSVIVTGCLLLTAESIVSMMSTPEEAVSGTIRYLTICFCGIPFITAYNIISSIFRGMGDSKSPMYFIAVACAANIALDYLFIGVMKLGPDYISHHFSLLLKKNGLPHIRFHDLHHTAGSLLLEDGVDIKTIQEFLGHSQTSTTTNIYLHSIVSGGHVTSQSLNRIMA